jgi:hypothetical protein
MPMIKRVVFHRLNDNNVPEFRLGIASQCLGVWVEWTAA